MSNNSSAISETIRIINVLNFTLYTMIVVFGVPGNVLVVWSLFSIHREKVNRSFKILVINLAINDIVIVLTTVFTLIELLSYPRFPFGPVMCSVVWPFQTACFGASVFNMVALNAHRYYLISFPTSRASLRRMTVVAVALCWTVPSLITALPYALTLEYKSNDCLEGWSEHIGGIFTVYLFGIQYVLPLIVIATLNLLTIRRLQRRYKFQSNYARTSADNLHTHHRIMKMLIVIIFVFALFGLPGQVMWLLPVFTNVHAYEHYMAVLSLVDVFNYMYCVLNPLIFFTYNKECYDLLMKLLAPLACRDWGMSSPVGVRREAAVNLLTTSRASDSQDTNGSDVMRIDHKSAPAFPKYILERLDENPTKGDFEMESNQHSVPFALYSSLGGICAPVFGRHGNSDEQPKKPEDLMKVTKDEESFSENFIELFRSQNVSSDLIQRLNDSPETAIVDI